MWSFRNLLKTRSSLPFVSWGLHPGTWHGLNIRSCKHRLHSILLQAPVNSTWGSAHSDGVSSVWYLSSTGAFAYSHPLVRGCESCALPSQCGGIVTGQKADRWVSISVWVVSHVGQAITLHGGDPHPPTRWITELRHCGCNRWASRDRAWKMPYFEKMYLWKDINQGWRMLPAGIVSTTPEPNACLHLCSGPQTVGSGASGPLWDLFDARVPLWHCHVEAGLLWVRSGATLHLIHFSLVACVPGLSQCCQKLIVIFPN